jgi:signal transduction histidine kinase
MLLSFSTIYYMTYDNIHQSIRQDLFRVADFIKPDNFSKPLFDLLIKPLPNDRFDKFDDSKNPESENDDEKNAFDARMNAFIIETDDGFLMRTYFSFFSSEITFYEQALEQVLSDGNENGTFKLDGNDWAYLVQNRPAGYVISFIDMTAQQNVLDRLIVTFIGVTLVMLFFIFVISNFLTERSIRPLKEAFDKQKQFISDASHELKTPLAVISANVDVLINNGNANANDDDVDNSKWLAYIKTEVERMSHLTRDLLYLTQMEDAEDHQMMKTAFSFSEKIEQMLLSVEAIAFEKNIKLDYALVPDAEIVGNSEQLSQVVMILLDNAIKYTPENGQIKANLMRTQHHFQLSITNTGEGISPEDLPHVFDRFYRGDKVRSRQSNSYGLGLAIAKTIIEQHGGKLTCESVPGEHTTFSVKLKMK